MLLLAPAYAQESRPPAGLPFTLRWIHGVCHHCQTASSLSEVQFTGAREAWAVGFRPPGGGMGFGDYSVLHSRDGARTWREIAEPWQHNEPPNLSFSSQAEGWLKDIDMVEGENRLLLTRDGGAHWRRLPMHDLTVDGIQYLGAGTGYIPGFNPYAKQAYLLATTDQGAHWREALLPKGYYPGLMDFADFRSGVLAGCLDHRMAAMRTSDGGAHWRTTTLDLPYVEPQIANYCDFEADSLGFADRDHGWMLTSKHVFGAQDHNGFAAAWLTADGGASWHAVLRAAFPETREQFLGMRFLDARLGFIWKYETVANKTKGVLLYTADGGGHWTPLDLPRVIWTCSGQGSGLTCAGGRDGFWVLRIAPAGAPLGHPDRRPT